MHLELSEVNKVQQLSSLLSFTLSNWQPLAEEQHRYHWFLLNFSTIFSNAYNYQNWCVN